MKTKHLKWLMIGLVAGVCLTTSALRADDKADKQASPDTEFLKEAAKGGMAEVKMGELAQQKGQSQSVKQFGDRLVKDHKQANQQLEKIAQRKNVQKPTDIGEAQKHLDMLSQLSGEEFDQAFIDHAVTDHEKHVQKFEKQASEGEDPAIRSFAREILPKLREHLRIAQTLKNNPNASISDIREPAGAEQKPEAQKPNGDDKELHKNDQLNDQQSNP